LKIFQALLSLKNFRTLHLSVSNDAPTSQVHTATMLVLLLVGNYKLQRWDGLQWHNVHTKFQTNQLTGSEVIGEDV